MKLQSMTDAKSDAINQWKTNAKILSVSETEHLQPKKATVQLLKCVMKSLRLAELMVEVLLLDNHPHQRSHFMVNKSVQCFANHGHKMGETLH